jgi:8-oxo-dGTP diphosphatase
LTTPWDAYQAQKQAAPTPEALRHLRRLEGSVGGTKADFVFELAKQNDPDFTLADVKDAEREANQRCMRCECDLSDCECPGGPEHFKRASIMDGMQWDPDHLAAFIEAGRNNWKALFGDKTEADLKAEYRERLLRDGSSWPEGSRGYQMDLDDLAANPPVPGEPGYAPWFARTMKHRLGQGGSRPGRDYDNLLARVHARRNGLPEPELTKAAAVDWKNRPGVRAVVTDERDRVLLLKRPAKEEFHPNTWNLPGGAKEPDEGFRTGALRELKEETGLTATPTGQRHVFTWPGGRGEAFAMEEPRGTLKLQAKEVAEARWFDPAKLPKKLFPQTAAIVQALVAKRAALKKDVELMPHQQAAVSKVLANDGSLLVAHGTGTGKTPTSAAAVEALRAKGKAHITLAVTPAALRENMIEGGVHKFTDQKGVILGAKGEPGTTHIDHPSLPEASYYAVSNEMFRKDPHKYIDKTHADTIVWDEIHKGRDDETANYAAMMAVRPKVRNFIGLTGTPVNNHPRDIVPVLDIVTNKRHGLGAAKGKGPNTFENRFMETVEKHHGPLGFLGIGPKSTETRLKHTDYLQHELSKHVHYVPTEDVAKDMPAKEVHDVEVPMSGHQQNLYHFAMNKIDPMTRWKIRMNLPVGQGEAQHIFARITKARQVSNAVHTLDGKHDPRSSAEATPKIHRLVEDVDREMKAHPNNKAIVYTNFVHGGVDAVAEGLRARGHDPGFFLGSTHQTRKDRAQHVQDYLSGKRRIMIINSAGTEGLNLPGTTSHHTLDPHFNPAVTEQQEARGIRAGSPVKSVRVYRYRSTLPRGMGGFLPAETSADQWVQNTADRKEKLNHQFLGLLKG